MQEEQHALAGARLPSVPNLPTLTEHRRRSDLAYLTQLMRITMGSVAAAARLAGRHRTEFYRTLVRAGVNPKAFREPLG